MKAYLEIVELKNDVITVSETECSLPAIPYPAGNAPEQGCPAGA